MTTHMLIDARHPEETRVAVVKGNRIEEFDFESAERKQLKGNIYLAKVTRVEPSLQAAFVDFGGNRHGFLAFSEIHPDYYQIPKEDREALLREEAEHAAEEEALRAAEDDDDDADTDADADPRDYARADSHAPGLDTLDAEDDDHADDVHADDIHADDIQDIGVDDEHEHDHDHDAADAPPPPAPISSGGGDDNAVEALRARRMNLRRRYKIQDVIHRRQVLLVQVVKEERGNKGAALTTYLSLAGRYCVLMPNTSHGGGISRKISSPADRKRLKSIMAEMQLPRTMGCIVRTAGLSRSRTEIRRDFDYLARLWDGIRENTLKSSAPALVYGDSDLIKRAIRDIYNRDIEEVIVEGEGGFRQAREFMKMLMPSHTRRIQAYADAVPLFQRFGVEDQLSAMYQPVVQLKSGGYLVINPTEALVSIDINSGRSTREHNIEQTATATNLEAAREIARQLRLRDMAGLVVIDFIDMENNANVRKVEKAMKEALKDDRARIQIGRISSFGLMEMSRQRLRTGVLEASTRPCPHCEGTGFVRTASSAGLSALRMLEDEAARGRGSQMRLRASQEAAIYVLNRKRGELAQIEDMYGVHIEVVPTGEAEGARMTVEVGGPPPEHAPRVPALPAYAIEDDDDLPLEEDDEDFAAEEAAEPRRDERRPAGEARPAGETRDEEGGDGRRRRRRRRRGGRGGREDGDLAQAGADQPAEGDEAEALPDDAERTPDALPAEGPAEARAEGEEEGRPRRGRRGRRGGRGRRNGSLAEADAVRSVQDDVPTGGDAPVTDGVADELTDDTGLALDAVPGHDPEAEAEAPRRGRRRPRARVDAAPIKDTIDPPAALAIEPEPTSAAPAPAATEEDAPKPKRPRRRKADAPADAEADAKAPEPVVAAEAEAEPAAKPRRPRRKAVATEEAAPVPADPAAAPVEEDAAAEPVPADTEATATADATATVDATAEASDSPATDANGAPRRGWWQRTFGA